MKTYKLLKDLPFTPKGTIFNEDARGEDWLTLANIKPMVKDEALEKLEWIWFEEIKEKEKESPTFKIWDYAILKRDWEFILITSITSPRDIYTYNYSHNDSDLRKPTKQELDLYFR